MNKLMFRTKAENDIPAYQGFGVILVAYISSGILRNAHINALEVLRKLPLIVYCSLHTFLEKKFPLKTESQPTVIQHRILCFDGVDPFNGSFVLVMSLGR